MAVQDLVRAQAKVRTAPVNIYGRGLPPIAVAAYFDSETEQFIFRGRPLISEAQEYAFFATMGDRKKAGIEKRKQTLIELRQANATIKRDHIAHFVAKYRQDLAEHRPAKRDVAFEREPERMEEGEHRANANEENANQPTGMQPNTANKTLVAAGTSNTPVMKSNGHNPHKLFQNQANPSPLKKSDITSALDAFSMKSVTSTPIPKQNNPNGVPITATPIMNTQVNRQPPGSLPKKRKTEDGKDGDDDNET